MLSGGASLRGLVMGRERLADIWTSQAASTAGVQNASPINMNPTITKWVVIVSLQPIE
jgi:hypothetical protein